MPNADEVTGLLLAGGSSTRFGSDKARYRVDGVALIRRVYDVLAGVTGSVLVSVRDAGQRYDDLLSADIRYVEDAVPGAGPLAGLAAGCDAATTPWLLVAACDLPFLTAGVLSQLLDARTSEVDAVVGRTPDGRTHPHCAAYRRVPAQEATSALLAADRYAFHALLDRLSVATADVPAESLRNVNRPGDVP